MKQFIVLSFLLLAVNFGFAQATEGLVTYQKKQQSAAVIMLPYSTDVVSTVMSDYLLKKGSSGTDIKGFKTYRNTQIVSGDSTNADLYFKIERTSRKEKDQSTVSLMVGAPNEDIANRNPGAQFGMEQAKSFLNNLVPVMEAYKLEMQIKDLNDLVIKEEKKSQALKNDGQDLVKKKYEIEGKIESNKQNQNKQDAEVEKQKQALALLISQRKA
jgi:hypothetical protein